MAGGSLAGRVAGSNLAVVAAGRSLTVLVAGRMVRLGCGKKAESVPGSSLSVMAQVARCLAAAVQARSTVV